jgi:hypothetical protein
MATEPTASPSSPSVRLTAFDEERRTKITNGMYTIPSGSRTSLRNGTARAPACGAGVAAERAINPAATATNTCRRSFCRTVRPRLLCRRTINRSSINPTLAKPTVATNTVQM